MHEQSHSKGMGQAAALAAPVMGREICDRCKSYKAHLVIRPCASGELQGAVQTVRVETWRNDDLLGARKIDYDYGDDSPPKKVSGDLSTPPGLFPAPAAATATVPRMPL